MSMCKNGGQFMMAAQQDTVLTSSLGHTKSIAAYRTIPSAKDLKTGWAASSTRMEGDY